jgi:hypothetical protein
MNKPCNPASVGLHGYQLEDVERLEDAFKTHRANRGTPKNLGTFIISMAMG